MSQAIGRLPTPQQQQTLRFPAVALGPASRHRGALAPLSKALPRRKSSRTCRRRTAGDRLGMSLGVLTPVGAARRTLIQSFGHFCFRADRNGPAPIRGADQLSSIIPPLGAAQASRHVRPRTTKDGRRPGRRRFRYLLASEGQEGNQSSREGRTKAKEGYLTAGEVDAETAGDFHPGPPFPVLPRELPSSGGFQRC